MIYVISDIHGNIDALKMFFKKIKMTSNDNIIALGDYIGYYYNTNECLDLLRKNKIICILGNHDENFLKYYDNKKMLKRLCDKYGNAYSFAKKNISSANMQFLKKLKKNKTMKFGKTSVKFSHGSPWKIDQYIYPNTDISTLKRFKKFPNDVFFVGHTHRKLELKFEKKIIYNPGSIGQPRDGKKGLHWIEFNEKNLNVKFKSAKYEVKKLKEQILFNDKLKYKQLSKYL
jgi:putative phosphoesterase